jgi:cobaltochelatase CobT
MAVNKNFRTPFKQTTKVETNNVAVTLLLDCSGSMSGEKIEVARQTGLALGESLKQLNIAFEMLGFNTGHENGLSKAVSESGLSPEDLQRFTRKHTTLRLMIFKSFEKSDLSGICRATVAGANEDGESLTWAAKRLALRGEKRKILIVLSDGQPAGEGSGRVLSGDLKRVVKLLPLSGIEVIGVGIQTDAPKDFYPDWCEVRNVKDLPSVVVGEFSKILLRGMK